MIKIGFWLAVTLIAVSGLGYFSVLALRSPELPPGFLYGNGHVEGTEVAVSAEVTGRVLESTLQEGETVDKGDLLVRLDDAELTARLAQARAQAQALVQEQVQVAAQLETAKHHRKTAEADLSRYRELRQSGLATPQQLSQAEDAAEEAHSHVEASAARQAQLAAELEAARRQVDLLQIQLTKTRIEAPIEGTVLAKGIEVGELATPGRVVAVLVDLGRLELTVYVSEQDIGKIKLGDPARVRVDAFPERYFEAGVARVDQRAQFTPRDIHMPEERVRMVFGVTLTLANPQGYLKPGMPADAWIRWDSDRPWSERLVVPEG